MCATLRYSQSCKVMAKAPRKITVTGIVVGWAVAFALTALIAFLAIHTLNHLDVGPSRIGESFPPSASSPGGING